MTDMTPDKILNAVIDTVMTKATRDCNGLMPPHWNVLVVAANDLLKLRGMLDGSVIVPARPTAEQIEEGAQSLMRWEDTSIWPDSFDAMQVTAARQDAERVYLSMVNMEDANHD